MTPYINHRVLRGSRDQSSADPAREARNFSHRCTRMFRTAFALPPECETWNWTRVVAPSVACVIPELDSIVCLKEQCSQFRCLKRGASGHCVLVDLFQKARPERVQYAERASDNTLRQSVLPRTSVCICGKKSLPCFLPRHPADLDSHHALHQPLGPRPWRMIVAYLDIEMIAEFARPNPPDIIHDIL